MNPAPILIYNGYMPSCPGESNTQGSIVLMVRGSIVYLRRQERLKRDYISWLHSARLCSIQKLRKNFLLNLQLPKQNKIHAYRNSKVVSALYQLSLNLTPCASLKSHFLYIAQDFTETLPHSWDVVPCHSLTKGKPVTGHNGLF